MTKSCCRFFTLLFVLQLSMGGEITAQISSVISSVNHTDPVEGTAVDMRVEFFQSGTVNAISLYYRAYGSTEYTEREMSLVGGSASVTIPSGDVTAPLVEYYFGYRLSDGTVETYPYNMPYQGNPHQLQVRSPSPKDKEVLVLSPENGELINLSNLFISVSLLKASENVDKKATKLFVNNVDISEYLLITGDMLLFYYENFPGTIGLGKQLLRIELYDTDGNLYHEVSSVFITYTPADEINTADQILYHLRIAGESRNEDMYGDNRWYNSLDLNADAEYRGFRLESRLYVTSEETEEQQPYNRYYAGLIHRYFTLKGGDVYPSMPSLIMNGKKVRGFEGMIRFDFFSLHTAIGKVRRGVEGKLLTVIPEGLDTLATNIIDLNDSTRAAVEFGTYERNLFAIRPLFSFSDDVSLGFSYLHSQDDMESIQYGTRPLENAVFGADFNADFDNKNIRFGTEAAFSLYNDDITTGTLTDEEIDDIFGDDGFYSTDPEDAKKLKDIFKSFITFNQFLYPLNPQELATFAAEGSLTLNYFQNNVKASYLYRGNDFHSFGNTFLRKDIAGLTVKDRVRLFDNRLFLMLGFERLHDNLQETKQATTTYNTYSASVSYFPGSDYPAVTLGYINKASSNDIDLTDTTLSHYYIDDLTDNYSLQLSYSFDYHAVHRTSFSLMHSRREDNSFYDYDLSTTSLYFGADSRWTRRMQSNLVFSYSQSDIAGSEFTYVSLTAGLQYALLPDLLILSASASPSFGDLDRVAFDTRITYSILHNLNLLFRFRYLKNANRSDDSIISLTTRFDLR